MSCWETIQDYGLRSLGIGERLLPRTDFTLCEHFVLIGSGMIWNVYFGVMPLVTGFCLPTAVALELFHNAFLVHDDIEDESLHRRGAPTMHQDWGIAIAINEQGGTQAVNLRIAEQYLNEFGKLAKTNNTMIIPSDLSDIAGIIAAAKSVIATAGAARRE